MESKRDRILTTAEEAFLEHGFDGTSIDAIIRAVGGSKSTIYAHFPDKNVLFAEALEDIRSEFDFSLPRFRGTKHASPREALTVAGIELLTIILSVRATHLTRLVVAESKRFPEVARRYWDEGPATAVGHIAAYLRACADAGMLDVPDAHRAAHRFLTLLRGDFHLELLLGLRDTPEPGDVATRAARAVDDFLKLYGQVGRAIPAREAAR